MKSYIIEGGKKIEGNVRVSGSKNAALPILAATILCPDSNKLYNIPKISDTENTLEILKILGCKIKQNHGKIYVNSRNINTKEIPSELMSKMRSTVILAGAILGRFKEVIFSYPGGCDIGARPIDIHINAFKKLGIEIKEENGYVRCKADKIIGTDINLDFPSVGATENIILATVLADGKTTINNAAMEPEIIDMVKFLRKMGAKIFGEGTNQISIIGVKHLSGTSYNIMPDRIEAGTLLCAAAATGGKIVLSNSNSEHMGAIINKLDECGCQVSCSADKISLSAPKKLKHIEIKTMIYPGFPTDLQQVFTSMMTKSSGTSIIVENIFENRYKFISELRKMGAKIVVEGRTAIVTGKRKLQSAEMICTDLRGGAALVIAAMTAKGISKISNIEYILRGYENFDKKLSSLGAKIRIEDI
ncbi:MAG: UDP-N-acetylglucosamine 1-carboxyvinyltransferase [Clostridia bacterium]|nr:UDP-N-acetylglucosamine 1-carboxyvinyltransferase [Clostridia bacterium]